MEEMVFYYNDNNDNVKYIYIYISYIIYISFIYMIDNFTTSLCLLKKMACAFSVWPFFDD